MHEDYILDALEMVSAWDLPDEDLADAVNAQARLMAGIHPDEFWEGNANTALTDHPYRKSFSNTPLLSLEPHRSVCICAKAEDVARPSKS